MSRRFIVIVLDSFGVGYMADTKVVRPQDEGSNTAYHLLEQNKKYRIYWPNLLDMGLMNAVGKELCDYKLSPTAVYGISNLKHYGADSFYGHQEIAGTDPKMPVSHTIFKYIQEIQENLEKHGHKVERVFKDGNQCLCVDGLIIVGDNMETDLGQAINVIGALDYCGMDAIKEVGHLVREIVKVSRVIAFGGSEVSIEDIKNAMFTKGEYIGVDAPGSGVYRKNYHVEHIGYGIDPNKQVPIALNKVGINNYFYGKVANIVFNPKSENSKDGVDTTEIFEMLFNDLKKDKSGFYFTNIQETDLAGHAEDSKKYIDKVNISDYWIGKIRELLNEDDILLIMADHGNDPTIGHSKHTREKVPLLIDFKNRKERIFIGERKTMADVGQTVANYFNTSIEFGNSFLDMLNIDLLPNNNNK